MARKKILSAAKLLQMPTAKPAPVDEMNFSISLGAQRIKFELTMTSQEIRDGELVDISTSRSSGEFVKPAQTPKRRG